MSSPRKNTDKPLTPRRAWQPLTPRGIAAFAHATSLRLILAQLVVAILVAITVVWFLLVAWFPVITEAIQRLPGVGEIRGTALSYDGPTPVRLAENSRLALVVDPDAAGTAGRVADLEITFERRAVAICGTFGCRRLPYERGYWISFNRTQLEPAWGAWRGPALGLVVIVAVGFLFAMWWLLALLYTPLVKLIAFYADRRVEWGGAWRLSAAALLPGALLVALAVVLYGFGAVRWPEFVLLYLLHLVAGWIFVVTSPLFLPKMSDRASGKNPFSAEAD